MSEACTLPRLVIVTWDDSRQPAPSWRWISTIDPPTAVRCLTVGWLIAESDQAIAVATSVGDLDDKDGDRQAAGISQIPRRCILEISDLVRTEAAP